MIAKERLAAYPFDMANRMLAVIRQRIASTSNLATLPMKPYETARMGALQAEISTTVGELRIAVVTAMARPRSSSTRCAHRSRCSTCNRRSARR